MTIAYLKLFDDGQITHAVQGTLKTTLCVKQHTHKSFSVGVPALRLCSACYLCSILNTVDLCSLRFAHMPLMPQNNMHFWQTECTHHSATHSLKNTEFLAKSTSALLTTMYLRGGTVLPQCARVRCTQVYMERRVGAKLQSLPLMAPGWVRAV